MIALNTEEVLITALFDCSNKRHFDIVIYLAATVSAGWI